MSWNFRKNTVLLHRIFKMRIGLVAQLDRATAF